MSDLGLFEGGRSQAMAYAVNDRGQVAGVSGLVFDEHAFLRTPVP